MSYINLTKNAVIKFGDGHLKFLEPVPSTPSAKLEIEYVSKNGDYHLIQDQEILNNLIASHSLDYHVFSDSVCLITLGGEIWEFSTHSINYRKAYKIERTELEDEGFDYCFFQAIEEKEIVVLCYELGAIGFNTKGQMIWYYHPDELRVWPRFEKDFLVYPEYKADIKISLENGSVS